MDERFSTEELLKRCAAALQHARRLTRQVGREVERAMKTPSPAAERAALPKNPRYQSRPR